jgi:hypothetical protein
MDDLNVSEIVQIDLLNTRRYNLCALLQVNPILSIARRVNGWNTPQLEVECNTYIPVVGKLK